MPFAQLVTGPPGSGKTTYCLGIARFLNKLGRSTVIVNLDPANDHLPYEDCCAGDIMELITVEDVMEEYHLGPNGGLMYCMEYLEKNLDWLKEKLNAVKDKYILFDCPGQIELYTHHNSFLHLVQSLQKDGYLFCCVNLADSHYCSDPPTFVSLLMVCLSTMVKLELPHVNVLSKMDLAEKFGKWPLSLEYFTDMCDPKRIVEVAMHDDPFLKKYKKLTQTMAEVVEDFGLVSFQPLCINDSESIVELMKIVDKANGYVFGALSPSNDSIMAVAAGEMGWKYELVGAVQERYFRSDDDDDDDDNNNDDNGNNDDVDDDGMDLTNEDFPTFEVSSMISSSKP